MVDWVERRIPGVHVGKLKEDGRSWWPNTQSGRIERRKDNKCGYCTACEREFAIKVQALKDRFDEGSEKALALAAHRNEQIKALESQRDALVAALEKAIKHMKWLLDGGWTKWNINRPYAERGIREAKAALEAVRK
jgi:hypothetical protein